MIQNILVLGAGSAGLLAAISLRLKIPQIAVRVVRSPEIGVIGVGEGTTPNFPKHLFEYLGISRKKFHAMAEPTWKLGIRFLWGPRGRFDYTFDHQLDAQYSGLTTPNGYFCDEDFRCASIPSALMWHGKAFSRQSDGCPDIQGWHAFHIENEKFVRVLEVVAREAGVEIIDGKVTGHEGLPNGGIAAVRLEDGRRLAADLFIDCSGCSELLGKALAEPFVSFDRSLFCDRAVVGGWDRTDEPILLTPLPRRWTPAGGGRSSTNITSTAATPIPRNSSPTTRCRRVPAKSSKRRAPRVAVLLGLLPAAVGWKMSSRSKTPAASSSRSATALMIVPPTSRHSSKCSPPALAPPPTMRALQRLGRARPERHPRFPRAALQAEHASDTPFSCRADTDV